MPRTCPLCHAPLPDALTDCPRCGAIPPSFAPTLGLPAQGPTGPVTFDHPPGATLTSGTPPAPDHRGPPLVPGYDELVEIGQGGMGVVYRARQVGLNRVVALKVLRPSLRDDEKARARFRREAEAMAQLNHPGIVHVHEVGEHAGVPYFSMELVTGGSLADRLREGPLSFRGAASLVEQLARAVFAAHEHGLIHRDLKPANVMLAMGNGESGMAHEVEEHRQALASQAPGPRPHPTFLPKITDFGLARQVRDVGDTQAGAVLGTPAYMAPEQARGEGRRSVGKRADVYALGAVLYECLTGRPPFLGETMLDTLAQVVDQEPMPPSRLRRGCPRDLETICLRCLQKAPENRYVSALSLANDLAHFQAGEPIIARAPGPGERAVKWARRRPAAAALLALLALALGSFLGGVVYLAQVSEANRRREEGLRLEAEAAWREERLRREETDQERARTKRALDEAEAARRREGGLRGELAWTSYYGNITRAFVAVAGADIDEANRLLDECPPEMRHWEWGHLRRRASGPEKTVRAGAMPINVMALSPSSKLLAVGLGQSALPGSRGKVEFRDAATLEVDRALPEVDGAVMGVAFRPDGRQLISIAGSFNLLEMLNGRRRMEEATAAEAQLWDLAIDQVIDRWRRVSAAAWSPDGKHLATARLDGRVTVREYPSDDVHFRSLKQPGLITKLVYSADGWWLAASWQQIKLPEPGGQPGSGMDIFQFGVSVWDARTGKLAFEVTDGLVFAFSPDSLQLAVGMREGLIDLWDLRSRRPAAQLRGHSAAITALAYRPAQKGVRDLLVSGDLGRSVRVWDLGRRRTVGVILGHPMPPTQLIFSPDGGLALSASQDGQMRGWDLLTNSGPRDLPGPAQPSGPPAFSPDGRFVFAPGQTGMRAYELPSGKPLDLPEGMRWSVAVAKSGLLAAGADREVRLYEVGKFSVNGKPTPVGRVPTLEKPLALALDAKGERLFVGSMPEGPGRPGLIAHDVKGRKDLWSLSDLTLPVMSLSLSPDGRHLATLLVSGAVRLHDAGTGRVIRELEGGLAVAGLFMSLGAVAFSPDGRHLAAGTGTFAGGQQKQSVKLWDVATGKLDAQLPGHEGAVTGLAFSPDGNRLAVSSIDLNRATAGEVRLWDVRRRTVVLTLPGQRGVAFSPDGRRLAAVGFEDLTSAVLRVWEAAAW